MAASSRKHDEPQPAAKGARPWAAAAAGAAVGSFIFGFGCAASMNGSSLALQITHHANSLPYLLFWGAAWLIMATAPMTLVTWAVRDLVTSVRLNAGATVLVATAASWAIAATILVSNGFGSDYGTWRVVAVAFLAGSAASLIAARLGTKLN